ncbi:acyltransferase domain-containing protein [Streptomyces sp. NPDC058045]|uniref:acyltransferase domain-containing protein n=1 Tax=Streptomyces sp. NPDC058045 TaxID=3346311 RepID=UPI0036E05026
MSSTVYLLGGQGSQYMGMASSLYEQNSEFRHNMGRLDAVCLDRYGWSPAAAMYDPSLGLNDAFDDLAKSNAAIFMVEYSLGAALAAEGLKPDVLVGSSLGEFGALAVAGHVAPEDGLRFVVDMALLLEKALPRGGMLAVLGDPRLYEELPILHQHTEVASVNHDGHFVLSGAPQGLERAAAALKERGLMAVPLPVSKAFHSSALDSVREEITALAESFAFDLSDGDSTAPLVVSSTTADVLTKWAPEDCWKTLRRPIGFTKSLAAVPGASEARYVDLTPSSTLSTIMKTSHRGYRTYPIITPFGTELAHIKTLLADLLP